MEEPIDLVEVASEKSKAGGLSISVIVSFVLHAALIVFFVTSYRPQAPVAQNSPMMRYVELIKQNPGADFVEAPGPEVSQRPLRAPLSDKNRKASMPEPTGDTPTRRPGDGSGLYQPPVGNPLPRAPQQQARPQVDGSQARPQTPAATQPAGQQQPVPDDTFAYRELRAKQPQQNSNAAASAAVDWRSAIKEVGKVATLGGGDGLDLGNVGGGDRGTAEQGPLSFETSWYDWGPYAQSMISKIRVNWYANMPPLIRTGIGGVVTIRFTIQRDGRITDITTMKSSGHPPYDFAARKSIELSSPLQALPRDFPNANERVTAMFYYNTPLP